MYKKRLHVDHPELPLRSRRADRSKLSRYVHAYCSTANRQETCLPKVAASRVTETPMPGQAAPAIP